MSPTPHQDMPTSYEEIKKKCLAEGSLFEDPDFPATFRSLFLDTVHNDLIWKRPKELKKTAVFIREATYRDLNQGQLGDCWFISAVNVLLINNRKIFEKVVPSNQSFTEDYAGIFRFNFWSDGEWKEVTIDDKLPVDRVTEKMLYAHNISEPDEFWVCLLEKAYAKLSGRYAELKGGIVSQGLVDMTGGITEYIRLDETYPTEVFQVMTRMDTMKSMFSCAIISNKDVPESGTKEGLFTFHAYAVIKLAKVQYKEKEVKLVKLRNPWGKKEWNGPWSDSSQEWNGLTEEERKRMKLEVKDDGEFWMDIVDFANNFDILDMCHVDPFAVTGFQGSEYKESTNDWYTFRADDRWLKNLTSGGNDNSQDIYWKNPQYLLEIHGCDVEVRTVISLLHRSSQEPLKIGIHLYKLNEGYPSPLPERFDVYGKQMQTRVREHTERETTFGIELVPGSYVIVPYTTDNTSAEFILRVFTESAVNIRSLDEVDASELETVDETTKPSEDILGVLFQRNTTSAKVDAHQLRRILNAMWRTEKLVAVDIFSLETCRCIIEKYDKSRDGLLTLDDTRKGWKFVNICQRNFNACDIDDSGTVDINELLPFYRLSHSRLSKAAAVNICVRYADQNGHLTFDDFCQSQARLTSLTKIFVKHFSQNDMTFNTWFSHIMNPRYK